MTPLQSDARLARRAAAGDERAFAAIYRRYHQDLFRFCLSIVGRPEDAQDALQNTMVKALRALPGEQREIQLKPWLYRVAHNESIDLLRRRREGVDLEAVSVAGAVELTETVAQRDRLGRLLADLETLPERQRSALVMRELSGLEYKQIAEAFESSESVARQTVYEARLNLRELEAGREMRCDLVTKQISEADGRTLRRRDIQAHLRSCPDCRAFRDAIESRRGDLAALTPLPALAAGSILNALLGGGQAAGGVGAALGAGVGAGAGKAVTASVIVKSAATVAAVAAIGVTTADRTGLIHAGLPGGKDASHELSAPATPAGSAGGLRGTPGAPSSAQTNMPAESRPVDASGDRSSPGRPAKGPGTGGNAGHKESHPSSASPAAHGELPAASQHGQETAASHGGGRAAAEAKAQGKSQAAPGKQGSVPGQAVPPVPPDTRPEPSPSPDNPPDNAPTRPLQPSQQSIEPGPPEGAAGHGSKEAR